MATFTRSTTSRPVDAGAFAGLLAQWNRHQDVRATTTTISELATSRFQLDAARFQYHRALR